MEHISKPIRRQRCAIYTRKSSEEGLEQEFNSLHAQREACEAYIASQRSEGWVSVKELAEVAELPWAEQAIVVFADQ